MSKQPLAEVFGFPIDNFSKEAENYRINKLCPYNNKLPNCTKDKKIAPLGVCSIFDGDNVAITCPIRFRQNWTILKDAADFLFPAGTVWQSFEEVRLMESNGKSAGNLDFILVSYDEKGEIIDFGSLEVQAVYISGNDRKPFEYYIQSPKERQNMTWNETNVRPDYLSSSRKRLVPQMIFKGGIFKSWGKKQAVALHEGFFNNLPSLPTVDKNQADIAWLIYGMDYDSVKKEYKLVLRKTVYTLFNSALDRITLPQPGNVNKFKGMLQIKLYERLNR
jgi:hypothetical protein